MAKVNLKSIKPTIIGGAANVAGDIAAAKVSAMLPAKMDNKFKGMALVGVGVLISSQLAKGKMADAAKAFGNAVAGAGLLKLANATLFKDKPITVSGVWENSLSGVWENSGLSAMPPQEQVAGPGEVEYEPSRY